MRNHIFKGFVWFLCEFTISIYRENIDALDINKYNLEPDACIFVDDRQANIKAAANNGLNGIYFNSYDEASREIVELINKRNTI